MGSTKLPSITFATGYVLCGRTDEIPIFYASYDKYLIHEDPMGLSTCKFWKALEFI